MLSGREAILARLRDGVGKGASKARRAAAEAWLAARQRGPQPASMGALADRFAAKARSLASTVETVATAAEAPAAVARFLASEGLGRMAVATPSLATYDWAGAGLAVDLRPAAASDRVGLSDCFCAIAETGTLMLLSGAATPATVSLLPETHIALVTAARLVPTMEAAFALLRSDGGELPRAVNFVSGPSRTGDIEQTIVLGAHGPCRVHLILIGEPS